MMSARSGRSVLGVVAMICSAALGSCAGAQRLTASADDWEDYRATRVESSLGARLRAADRYLRVRPHGAFAREVRTAFAPAETELWVRSRGTRAGLNTYLETLPQGPHAEEARARLDEVRVRGENSRRREAALDDEARELTERLEDADRYRAELLQGVAGWARRLAAIRSWHRPTSELAVETLFEFRSAEPRGRCIDATCRKSLSFGYAVPDGGRLRARRVPVDVEWQIASGGVVSAKLAGPELWSRLGEAIEIKPVPSGDLQRRTEAIARSASLIANAIEGELPAARCEAEGIATRVLIRRCDGVELTMIAAPSVEEDDRLEVAPLAR